MGNRRKSREEQQISAAATAMARKGGLARAKALSAQRRREIAVNAIAARWAKAKRKAKS
jgi:hypothetical protein